MNNANYKYVSINTIAARVTKHPLLKDLNLEDIIDHTVDVLRLVNIPKTYVEKSCYKNVIDYKAAIPTESLKIVSVDHVSNNSHLTPMVQSTDTHQAVLEKLPTVIGSGALTYKQASDRIHTNFKDGLVFIVYESLECDKDGIPKIPDNISLMKAIENYIKVQVFSPMVDMQKLNQNALHRAEQEYSWYIGKAQTDFQGFDNDDSKETYLSDFKRMFDNVRTHKDRHRYNSNRELRIKN